MINRVLRGTALLGAIAAGLMLTPHSVEAFTIRRTLTGDPRSGNPDQLRLTLTIQTGADAGLADNQALWTVDIDSPAHPNIRLDEFYFNLSDRIRNFVTFSNFSPVSDTGNTWGVFSPANNAQGSGGADFDFGVRKAVPGGRPNERTPDVTNAVNLVFRMTLSDASLGALQLTDFTAARYSESRDSLLGLGQVGAHLQSLTVNSTTCPEGGCSDSGFVMGEIPTPAMLPGLMGLAAVAMRRRKAEEDAEQSA